MEAAKQRATEIITERKHMIDARVEQYIQTNSRIYKDEYLEQKAHEFRRGLESKLDIYTTSLMSLVDRMGMNKYEYDIYGPQSPYDSFSEITDIREQALSDFQNFARVQISREKMEYSDFMEGRCVMLRCTIRVV